MTKPKYELRNPRQGSSEVVLQGLTHKACLLEDKLNAFAFFSETSSDSTYKKELQDNAMYSILRVFPTLPAIQRRMLEKYYLAKQTVYPRY